MNNHRDTEEVPVLVAGAGPAGLMTAIALARAGVRCVLVERRSEPSSHPRATVISTRSMELFHSWGLETPIRELADDVEWLLWRCETLARAGSGSGYVVGYPSREQSARVSPCAPLCVPQDLLEPILMSHLRSLPAARVLSGAELVGLRPLPEGAEVSLRGPASTVRARYVVGADGARSAVRSALGIDMHGPDHLSGGLTVLFRAPLWELLGEHRYGVYGVMGEAGAGAVLPAGHGDRWIYGFDPGTVDRVDEGVVADRIRAAAGAAGLRPRIESMRAFSFAAQLSERFRQGDVFLVGDAAHRVTPRGGTGMNIAIQDGYDLGWKLAWVLRGWAREELLDSYEAERRPVAAHNVARSADPDGSVREVDAELRMDLGRRLAHVWQGGRSTLDLVGPGLTLFSGPEGAPRPAAGPAPLGEQRLDEPGARALGLGEGEALLVRPDGVPAGEAERYGRTARPLAALS